MLVNPIAAGRILRDVVTYHDEIGLRFSDGVEARVAWGSQGPELKSVSFEWISERDILTEEVCMPKRFQYCIGKRIQSTATEIHDRPDGRRLHLQFDDGHVIVIAFLRQPEVRKVDVNIRIELPPMLGHASGLQ